MNASVTRNCVTRAVRSVVEWAIVLVIALGAPLLLTSAAAYAAADVWVLWSKFDGSYEWPNAPYKAKATATYKIDAAYADRATCIRAIDAHLATMGTMKSPDEMITRRVDTSELGDGKGSYWIEERDGKLKGVGEYVCLPDKVDPPGPKAR